MIDLSFPHRWHAEILTARPLILPLIEQGSRLGLGIPDVRERVECFVGV